MATGLDCLDEREIRIARVMDHQATSLAAGCPADLVAIGTGLDGHEWICFRRHSIRQAKIGVTVYCNEDQSTAYYSLPEGLVKWIEGAEEIGRSLEKADIPAAWLEDFRPRLVPRERF